MTGQAAFLTRRRWLAGAAGAVIAGCGRSVAPPLRLRVGVLGTADDLPLHVMQRQGYDRRHGLQHDFIPFAGGAQVVDALAAGSLDVSTSIGTIPLLVAAEAGVVPAKVIAIAANSIADPEHPLVGIVVGKRVSRWVDLNGSLIATHSVNSVSGAAAIGRLQREGVTGYRFVTVPLPNQGLAIADGSVAAATMSEPFLTQSVRRGDGRLLGWIVGGPPFERLVVTVVTVRTGLLKDARAGLARFLSAFLDAVRWIDSHEADARALVAVRLGLTDELSSEVRLLKWPRDARVDRALFTSQQAVLVETGVMRRAIAVDQVLDEELLVAVLRERRA